MTDWKRIGEAQLPPVIKINPPPFGHPRLGYEQLRKLPRGISPPQGIKLCDIQEMFVSNNDGTLYIFARDYTNFQKAKFRWWVRRNSSAF